MIKIYIFVDSYKHFETPINEYIKRLGKTIELIKLKPVKKWTNSQIIESETDLLLEKLSKEKWYKIVLNPEGKSYDTRAFYDLIELKKQTYPDIIFAIGWAWWLNYDKLKQDIDFNLNLGNMTMPHSLALLVLLEQIYRLDMIKKWTSYDK